MLLYYLQVECGIISPLQHFLNDDNFQCIKVRLYNLMNKSVVSAWFSKNMVNACKRC